MDFGFTEAQNILRDSVRKLMDKHAPPDYVRRLKASGFKIDAH